MPLYRVFIVDDDDHVVRARDLATLDHELIVDQVTQADEHLQSAEECMLIARLTSSGATKAAYLRLAELYRTLAAEEATLSGAQLPLT